MIDPWRYVCPACKSTRVDYRINTNDYRCNNERCDGRSSDGSCFTFDRPLDTKTGKRRRRFKSEQ